MINRREFLRAASVRAIGAGAALTGLPTIVKAAALGRDGHVAASERIVMGAVGLGWQGLTNMQSLLGKSEVQMVALCDVDAQLLSEKKGVVDKHYGSSDCATYVDFLGMFRRGDLDAVTIGLPDHWHAACSIDALRLGLDVFGEKPLAHSLLEGRAICDAVKRYGRIWQTGSWQRSQSNFHRACELVRNGRIGKVSRVEVGIGGGHHDFTGSKDRTQPEPVPEGLDFERWLGPAPRAPYCAAMLPKTWRWHLNYGGGMLLDWIGHHGDIAHWGLGLDHAGPVEVDGSAVFGTGFWNAPIEYEATCTYADGMVMVVSSKLRGGTTWYGNKGKIFVTRGGLEAEPNRILDEVIEPDEVRLYKSTDHYQNFLDGVRTRRETIAPAETAHRSASIGHLCLISMRLGRKLKWNPEKERFVNDPEADRMLMSTLRSPWTL